MLAASYAADDPCRVAVSERLTAGHTLFAPAHLDAEVVSALRSMARGNPVLKQADRAAPTGWISVVLIGQRVELRPQLQR